MAIIVIVLLIHVLAVPWLIAHAWIIVAGIAALIGTEMIAPDRKEVAAQAAVERTFNSKVSVTGERLDLDDHSVSALVHNESNARIYDVWLRCTFRVPKTQYKPTDPDSSKESISSDYHYSYIHPGTMQEVRLRLKPHGLLSRAVVGSFSCEARYEYEASDLFKAVG